MSTTKLPLTMPQDDEGATMRKEAQAGPKPDQADCSAGSGTGWLGLETDHRRLLEAGQDGWLHPHSGQFMLGRECFVGESAPPAARNAIVVRLVLDAKKLPRLGKDRDQRLREGGAHHVGAAGGWFAPIPLYAVTEIEVSSPEERSRLLALAGEFSNVSLPDAEIVVGRNEVLTASVSASGDVDWALPERVDAIQGAMAMAVWAVPRVDPWIEALQRALNQDAEGATEKVEWLAAPWLRFPWCDDSGLLAGDEEAQLWNAAVSSLRSPLATGKSPGQLAEAIAGRACEEGASETADSWLRRTRRVVTAEERFGPGEKDAGLAIQLVLLRPDPIEFRTWSRELPWLPPGTWWAAAVLCGWRHGYRGLDRRFRGGATLREFLATRALAASWKDHGDVPLPPDQQASLERRREEGCFSLVWGGRPVLRKRWHARAKWYTADLNDSEVVNAARQLADALRWGCFRRGVRISNARIPVSGEGSLAIDPKNGQLVVSGTVKLNLPMGAQVVEELDKDAFLRALASEAGVVPDPPTSKLEKDVGVPGLFYRREFITKEEEQELVDQIDQCKWSRQLKRGVQQYGWRYDYRQREVDASMRLGELPDWAATLAQRLVDEGLVDEPPDQLIVNEYLGNQGISAHIDQPHSFAEQVATISLLETWSMVFRDCDTRRKVGKPLERRSVAVFTGDARYRWTHEIPGRKYERELVGEKRRRIKRDRRISLTFRKVKGVDEGLFSLGGEAAV